MFEKDFLVPDNDNVLALSLSTTGTWSELALRILFPYAVVEALL
jgi:hypothetical protein